MAQKQASRRLPARKRTPRARRPERPAQEQPQPVEVAATTDEVREAARPLTIVGVGMSAGGLEACTQMLEALPAQARLAIVLIQHLAPHQRSSLPMLLAQHSRLRVIEAGNEMAIEPDSVYVTPPDVVIELADGGLRLNPRPAEPGQHAVDYFLSSLAAMQGERAIAVILSGTGTDGAVGVRQVKQHGGTVLAQQPDTAKYDGMPNAAIQTGLVDLVLAPADIARKLVDLAAYPDGPASAMLGEQVKVSDEQFEELVDLLRATSGVDFTHYKQPTVRRRIMRRMVMHRIPDVGRYISYLKERPDEARSLYQDILIHVTRFFRDPESFEALATVALPSMLDRQRPDNPLRIWVAGCATGEEVYSLAITVFQTAGDRAPDLNLQIFGTDVSEAAVDFARQGVYPLRIEEDVPPEVLYRFFTKADGGYRIAKTIRDRCTFARQDLTRDPPFSKLDLIVCRNVLIYMDASLQRGVLPAFHYALRPDGYLMLGQSETIGVHAELFSLIDKKNRIYRKRPADHVALAVMPPAYAAVRTAIVGRLPAHEIAARDARAVQNEANRVLLDRYGPPGVLVNDDLDIIQFRGRTGPYLEPAPGDASLSLLKLAREGLLHGLRSALQTARKTHKPVRKEGLRTRSNGGWTDVDLEVIPVVGPSAPHFLVLFDQPRSARDRAGHPAQRAAGRERKDGRGAERLEEELAATRQYLQSIVQEVEAANEELQSANEEILSSNEELQSTNEELDTAKEELQSTNEELNTLNEELHSRNEELTHVNSDLINILGSVQIAIVIVSTDLRVRRFTPMAEKAMNLIQSDVGRPITQLKPNIQCPDLPDLILEVVDKMTPIEREVRDGDGSWYSLRIRPYKGAENRIDGAVIALVDIDTLKRQEKDVADSRLARDYAEAIVETVREPLLVLDAELRVRTANRSFCDLFDVRRDEAEGRYLHHLGNGQWDIQPLRGLLETVLHEQRTLEGFEVDGDFPGIGRRTMVLNARAVKDSTGRTEPLILVAFQETVKGRV